MHEKQSTFLSIPTEAVHFAAKAGQCIPADRPTHHLTCLRLTVPHELSLLRGDHCEVVQEDA